MFKFKYNIIPNLLNKYYGKKIEGLKDEEIQDKNFKGESLRKEWNEKPYFVKLEPGEFDIDNNSKELIFEDNENDKHIKNRANASAFESDIEEKETAREIMTIEVLMARCEMAMNKCDDEEIKQLWKAITSSKNIKKINQQAEKKMGKTNAEIVNIKKRLTRYLLKEVPGIRIETFLKEELDD